MPVVNPAASITLITGPRGYTRQRMLERLIETALQEQVRILIGGNHFPVYQIAYALAARTGKYYTILSEEILLSRAETGYQLVELLQQPPIRQLLFWSPIYSRPLWTTACGKRKPISSCLSVSWNCGGWENLAGY
ncbi:MAG TPA: hypothetical protein VJ965_09705 [Anaerolineales bacterium]|nr:hypothetical protein [Anaerolineales bacterium]